VDVVLAREERLAPE
jgi:hypothetical protein